MTTVAVLLSPSRAARQGSLVAQQRHATMRHTPPAHTLSTSPSRHARTGRFTGLRTCLEGTARSGERVHEQSLHERHGTLSYAR
jgi:hypothetical protein